MTHFTSESTTTTTTTVTRYERTHTHTAMDVLFSVMCGSLILYAQSDVSAKADYRSIWAALARQLAISAKDAVVDKTRLGLRCSRLSGETFPSRAPLPSALHEFRSAPSSVRIHLSDSVGPEGGRAARTPQGVHEARANRPTWSLLKA